MKDTPPWQAMVEDELDAIEKQRDEDTKKLRALYDFINTYKNPRQRCVLEGDTFRLTWDKTEVFTAKIAGGACIISIAGDDHTPAVKWGDALPIITRRMAQVVDQSNKPRDGLPPLPSSVVVLPAMSHKPIHARPGEQG